MIDYLTPTAPLNTPQRLSWRAYEQIAPCKILLPTRPQADFADAVGHCLDTGHRIFAIDSGNATGKTTILQNVLLNIVYGKCCIYNTAKDMDDGKVFPEGFFAGSLYRKWPAGWPRLIWYVSHADVLKDTDRKSTRLNSSHSQISYAVFCLKTKTRRASLAAAAEDDVAAHRPPHQVRG